MKILPVLVYAEYDQDILKQIYDKRKEIQKEEDKKRIKEFPSTLYVLDSKFYPVSFRMEAGGDGCKFITRQHFQTKDDWHDNREIKYVPGFCIIDLTKESDFEIKYKPYGTGSYQSMVFIETSDKRVCKPEGLPKCRIFFELPVLKVKFKKNQYAFEYESEPDTAVLGYVNTGYTEIACFKKGNTEPKIKSYLKVLPSSMTEIAYVRMINDILAVHRTLLESSKGKQSISLQKSWYNSLLEIENRLVKLEISFNQIEKNFYKRLTLIKFNINKHNIKKFNDKLLIQFATQPSKQKYKADKLLEDHNIYEHRVFLWALKELAKFIERTTTAIQDTILFEQKKNEFEKSQIFSLFNLRSMKDLESLIDSLNVMSKDVIFDKLIKCKNDKEEYNEADPIVEGEVIFKNLIVYESEYFSDYNMSYYCSRGFIGNTFTTTYFCCDENQGKTNEFLLEFMSNNAQRQELLYRELSKIKVEIRNYSPIIKKGKTISLIGKYCSQNTNGHVKYLFYEIESIYVNNELKREAPFSEAIDHLKRVYCEQYKPETDLFLKIEDADTLELLGKELGAERKRFNSLDEQFGIYNSYGSYKKALINKISDLMRRYSFLCHITPTGNETWVPTLKFVNDPNYKAAYDIFHELNESYHFAEMNSRYSIIHQKANDLYEYWIFIKILEVLIIKQKWKLIKINDVKDVNKEISFIVSAVLSKQNNKLQNCSLVFEHEIGNGKKAVLSFLYNKDIFFEEPIDGTKSLRPDYHFILEYENEAGRLEKKHFCLDAKYRNYNEQKGIWTKDINKVCIDNYLIKLRKDLRNKSSRVDNLNTRKDVEEDFIAAFIIHCDNNSYAYWGGNLRKSVNIDKLNSMTSFPRHEIGSFPFLPNALTGDSEQMKFRDFERNLQIFFTMVFEYHCKLYNVCWECGNDKPQILKNGKSQHFLCNNCNRFWVKYHCSNGQHHLVKHKYNYHNEYVPHTHFLVMCPVCGDKLKVEE